MCQRQQQTGTQLLQQLLTKGVVVIDAVSRQGEAVVVAMLVATVQVVAGDGADEAIDPTVIAIG